MNNWKEQEAPPTGTREAETENKHLTAIYYCTRHGFPPAYPFAGSTSESELSEEEDEEEEEEEDEEELLLLLRLAFLLAPASFPRRLGFRLAGGGGRRSSGRRSRRPPGGNVGAPGAGGGDALLDRVWGSWYCLGGVRRAAVFWAGERDLLAVEPAGLLAASPSPRRSLSPPLASALEASALEASARVLSPSASWPASALPGDGGGLGLSIWVGL
ncbi:hypothetical protein EYF80_055600 [Liparis tanakae]|uniref:Uncharacterized protein n=1 Tax=Liparis tanakae TaxID=230148 RepID=A0A4Z2EZ55_9TELE|nr:hypothetical protein EYF80_055600 [Liparis tanakae]